VTASAPDRLIVPLPTRRATTRFGRGLATHLGPSDLVILEGALGAGKTFLARSICRGLGLPAFLPVTSPTFTLVQEYETSPVIAHADLYRLLGLGGGSGGLYDVGLDALRDDGAVLLVEWGLPFIEELGGDALVIDLALAPRAAHVSATGARARDLVRALAAGE
jgi:tRNA threonylcarbamoyladenosine biosynthesis protein TsaE